MKFLKSLTPVLYHLLIVVLSAAIALSLPFILRVVATNFLLYWSIVTNDKVFLATVEVITAVLLILFFNHIGRNREDRRFARMARGAGLAYVTGVRGFFQQEKVRRLKESHGYARDIMIMGSTGYRTFATSEGDLHNAVQNCREARILLLNPYSEAADARANSIIDPEITIERLREQTGRSIEFLRQLKILQKNVKLKFYSDMPMLKMAVSGDYMWVKHYHIGIDAKALPEYVFRNNQNPGSLYVYFYQTFIQKWHDPSVPEYDLLSDELVYRDAAGNEERREPLGEMQLVGVS